MCTQDVKGFPYITRQSPQKTACSFSWHLIQRSKVSTRGFLFRQLLASNAVHQWRQDTHWLYLMDRHGRILTQREWKERQEETDVDQGIRCGLRPKVRRLSQRSNFHPTWNGRSLDSKFEEQLFIPNELCAPTPWFNLVFFGTGRSTLRTAFHKICIGGSLVLSSCSWSCPLRAARGCGLVRLPPFLHFMVCCWGGASDSRHQDFEYHPFSRVIVLRGFFTQEVCLKRPASLNSFLTAPRGPLS